jgi:hypothetical protein
MKVQVELKEGQIKRVDFPLKAHRIIVGYVFEDANGDGVFQKGENVFAGVKVYLGDLAAETDKDGRYIFSDLKMGPQKITIDETTLPVGFIAVRDFLSVDLPAGYATLTGLDFPVSTRNRILKLFTEGK